MVKKTIVVDGREYVLKEKKGVVTTKKQQVKARTLNENLEYLKAIKGYKFENVKPDTWTRKDGKTANVLKAELVTESGKVPVFINAFNMWKA